MEANPSPIKPEIESRYRQMILERIPMSEQKPQDQQAILDMSLRDLLSTLFNWQNRRISIRPRTVYISRELQAKNRPEVIVIAEKIRKGEDLTPHLSERIETVLLANPKDSGLRHREDLDLLLNEWAIHHLHISTVLKTNGFVKRRSELLFATFRKNDAYLIELLDHDAFENEDLVKIAVANWPDAHLFSVMSNMTLQLDSPITSRNRRSQRDVAINTPVQLPTGLAAFSFLSGTGMSSFTEAKINQFWAKIVLDQDKCSVEDMVKALVPSLDWHPVSDR
jgi:hypothetical protein